MANRDERIRLMRAYCRFVQAAEARGAEAIAGVIRGHPELLSLRGNGLLTLVARRCPKLLETVFQAGLHPDLGGSEVDWTLLQSVAIDNMRDFPELRDLVPQPGGPDWVEIDALTQRPASSDNVALVRLCLRYGADVDLRNCEGETALGFAAAYNEFEVVRVLVEEGGADVNALEGRPGEYPSTALDAAGMDSPGYERIHAYLKEHGAKRARELLGERDES